MAGRRPSDIAEHSVTGIFIPEVSSASAAFLLEDDAIEDYIHQHDGSNDHRANSAVHTPPDSAAASMNGTTSGSLAVPSPAHNRVHSAASSGFGSRHHARQMSDVDEMNLEEDDKLNKTDREKNLWAEMEQMQTSLDALGQTLLQSEQERSVLATQLNEALVENTTLSRTVTAASLRELRRRTAASPSAQTPMDRDISPEFIDPSVGAGKTTISIGTQHDNENNIEQSGDQGTSTNGVSSDDYSRSQHQQHHQHPPQTIEEGIRQINTEMQQRVPEELLNELEFLRARNHELEAEVDGWRSRALKHEDRLVRSSGSPFDDGTSHVAVDDPNSEQEEEDEAVAPRLHLPRESQSQEASPPGGDEHQHQSSYSPPLRKPNEDDEHDNVYGEIVAEEEQTQLRSSSTNNLQAAANNNKRNNHNGGSQGKATAENDLHSRTGSQINLLSAAARDAELQRLRFSNTKRELLFKANEEKLQLMLRHRTRQLEHVSRMLVHAKEFNVKRLEEILTRAGGRPSTALNPQLAAPQQANGYRHHRHYDGQSATTNTTAFQRRASHSHHRFDEPTEAWARQHDPEARTRGRSPLHAQSVPGTMAGGVGAKFATTLRRGSAPKPQPKKRWM